jgi:hypothetical protein
MMQWTSVLLLLLIAVAGYFAYTLLPAFEDNYTARQAIAGIVNQGWRHLGQTEIHRQILEKLSTIGSHVELPAGGQPIEVKGLPIDDDSVVVVCTDQQGDCSGADGEVMATVSYTRIISLPYLTGKTISLSFSPSAKESLHPVNWE